MTARVAVLILAALTVGLWLLALRQQRFALAHDMARLHRQIDEHRRDLWDQQERITAMLEPSTLRRAIARTGLDMDPVVGSPRDAEDHRVRAVSDRRPAPRTGPPPARHRRRN